jgi:hypothetical protein
MATLTGNDVETAAGTILSGHSTLRKHNRMILADWCLFTWAVIKAKGDYQKEGNS